MERFQVDVTHETVHRVIKEYNPDIIEIQSAFIFTDDNAFNGETFKRIEQFYRAGTSIEEQMELRDVCVGQVLQELGVIGEHYDYRG